MPAISRGPDGDRGYAVLQVTLEREMKVVGHLAVYDEDTFLTFQVLETLLRASDPLAQVLDAAGWSIVEQNSFQVLIGASRSSDARRRICARL